MEKQKLEIFLQVTTKFGTSIFYSINKNTKKILSKKCTKCLLYKPIKDFPKNKFSKFGRNNQCKKCESTRIKNIRRLQGQKSKMPIVHYKNKKAVARECSKCRMVKPFLEFSKSKKGFFKHESKCKQCKSKKYSSPVSVICKNGVAVQRICNHCKKMLFLNHFNNSKNRFLNKESICRVCKKEKRLFRKYNLTISSKAKLLKKQKYKCCSCNKTLDMKTSCVDHNHSTDKIRGLLCRPCNAAIGLLGDENKIVLNCLTNMRSYCKTNRTFSLVCAKPKNKRTKKMQKEDFVLLNGTLVQKRCPQCEETKDIKSFGKHKNGFMGTRSRCKKCEHKIYVEKTYNIDYETKVFLFENQNQKCKICEKEFLLEKFCIDHNHHTGEIRGLLCSNCNAAFGFIGDGDNIKTPFIINNLFSYLHKT